MTSCLSRLVIPLRTFSFFVGSFRQSYEAQKDSGSSITSRASKRNFRSSKNRIFSILKTPFITSSVKVSKDTLLLRTKPKYVELSSSSLPHSHNNHLCLSSNLFHLCS